MNQGVAGHVMQLKTIFKMKLKDFLVMIGLKLLVTGYLENTLRYTTPFNNSENSVMAQVLIYLSKECHHQHFGKLHPTIRQSKTDSSKPCIFCVRSEIILKEFHTPV